MMLSDNFDAIIVGSGIGGLTVASLLAQYAHKKVLVLEKHFKLGGFTHTFRRDRWEWDVGLHYVGGMKAQGLMRVFMDYITGGIEWEKIQDPFEHFVYPGIRVDVPSDEGAYRQTLISLFPHESSNIVRYFREIHAVSRWSARWFASKQVPSWVAPFLCYPGSQRALQSTQAYLQTRIQDPQLRAILCSQWGDYGLPPSQSCLAVHAGVTADYLEGGWYPSGGASQIAKGAVEQIEKNGGRCLVNHEVNEIVVEKGAAQGVVCSHKGDRIVYRAKHIFSDAGAVQTLCHLLPESARRQRTEYLTDSSAPTAITLYLGLRESPATKGFEPGNYWISDSLDHDAIYAKRDRVIDGEIHHAYLSFPSLRTKAATSHVAEIICFTSFDRWREWSHLPWKKRGEPYEAIKSKISNAILSFVESYQPGLRSLVEYQELSTPLSVVSLGGHAEGAIYGYPATVERYRRRLFPAKTHLSNLYLTGCDVGSVGINGAMMGGVMATAASLGSLGFPKLLRAAYRRTGSK